MEPDRASESLQVGKALRCSAKDETAKALRRRTCGSSWNPERFEGIDRGPLILRVLGPPRIKDAPIEFGLRLGPAELVPIGNRVRGLVPMWDPVVASA